MILTQVRKFVFFVLLMAFFAMCLTSCGAAQSSSSASQTLNESIAPTASPTTIAATSTTPTTITPTTTIPTTIAPTSPPTTPPTTTAVPTSGLPYTHWVLDADGRIRWDTPVPAKINFSTATILVAIPEGLTLVEICKLLELKGVQTFYHVFKYALENDFSSTFPMLVAAKAAPHRRYILEGYLFPDTYTFYTGESPNSILTKLLTQTSRVLAEYTPPEGMTMDQVLTIASLIEEEANSSSRANVSSVIHNRLDIAMKLQLDVTIGYCENFIEPLILSPNPMEAYNDFYNTYKCAALPAGPITNPGRAAISAAINPAASTYLFFFTDSSGIYHYATTYEEHLANIELYG